MQKFQYLRSSVTGDAGNVIKSLEISESNYNVAWKLLKDRYDNKRLVVNTHVKAIMELPTMGRENASELRKIIDGACKHVRALEALGRPIGKWDDVLVFVLNAKIDSATSREWQASLKDTELPTFEQLIKFLNHRWQVLESMTKSTHSNAQLSQSRSGKKQSAHVATFSGKCFICNDEHLIYTCSKFLSLPVPQRITEIRKRKLCLNCLKSTNHMASSCKAKTCKTCDLKHNTLLHLQRNERGIKDNKTKDDEKTEPTPNTTIATHSLSAPSSDGVYLSTALVRVFDTDDQPRIARVLLDCGSQANFITNEFLSKLKIKSIEMNIQVTGVNNTVSQTNRIAEVKVASRLNSFATSLRCIVADVITDKIPNVTVKRKAFELPKNITLADPQFHVASNVDMLIGAEIFWRILCVGQIKATLTHPTLQKTRFGWVIAGSLGGSQLSSQRMRALHVRISNDMLHEELTKFWKLDELNREVNNFTINEQLCENSFLENIKRNDDGRYIAKLPINQNSLNRIGESKSIATKRLHSVERKLDRNPELKSKYNEFLREYRDLGHMTLVTELSDRPDAIYLPHHCVLKGSSDTTKLRVVFDASCRTASGVSLNDALLVGPVVQQDLLSILVRFRTFRYALTADIIKMYRQILVHPSQTHLQRIVWREDTDSPVKSYELRTITYGTAPASFLATRCLTHLAQNNQARYPVGAEVVARDFYMDDMLTGADSLNSLKIIKKEVVELLRTGCFELSKWASNHADLVEGPRPSIGLTNESSSRVLGVHWDSRNDVLHFTYNVDRNNDRVTKRTVLSEISQLFDPLGILGPIVIVAKIIMQEIWQANVHWDESIPLELQNRWKGFKTELYSIDQLRISRCVKFTSNKSQIELHGFADASQVAYGACLYFRNKINETEYRTELLCSKTRVAPLRAVSLPRLELCAALLLAQLFHKIRSSLDIEKMKVYLWSDSTITLHWIRSTSRKWAPFVANRIGEIQSLTDVNSWRHVPSASNPADLISRGVEPSKLIQSSLWWHGPDYLMRNCDEWPVEKVAIDLENVPERRKTCTALVAKDKGLIENLLDKFSNWSKVCRVVAYCLRVKRVCNQETRDSSLRPDEIRKAALVICKIVQQNSFIVEYNDLSKGKPVAGSSGLSALSPFLDEEMIIRVGGRLRNALLSEEGRHPIVIPRGHRLTQLIIENEHVRSLHSGVQGTLSAVRQRFWPLAGRSQVKGVVRNCITCFKAKPTMSVVKMGDLPANRVRPSRPFSHCGVDYAGPVTIKEGKRKSMRNQKAYVAVFVCFATKACHLELVSDLSADSFLAALKRFIARRGKPSRMYSDNGTNFVGASRALKEYFESFLKDEFQAKIRDNLSHLEIRWSFIPPNAPHFGGLWEAAVKSMKIHLSRVVGNAHLTFEELYTTLCEIEAILNSRPIGALSEDPNDLTYLTPGHFLIGTALSDFPQPDICDIKENRLIRWQRVEQLRQQFWKIWSTDYLQSLQERSKWKLSKGLELKIGQVVLLRQQGLAPLQWSLGRIQAIHRGSDGLARVATVKTASGTFTRPLSKLAILPID